MESLPTPLYHFFMSQGGILSSALTSTNKFLDLSKDLLTLHPNVPLTDTNELSKLFRAFLIMNLYRFPSYKNHFEESPAFFRSPILDMMTLERFRTLCSCLSFGENFTVLGNFLFLCKKNYKNTFSEYNEFVLKTVNFEKASLVTLIDKESGYLIDGVWLTVEINEETVITTLLADYAGSKFGIILENDWGLYESLIWDMGLVVLSKVSHNKIPKEFFFAVIEEFEFLGEREKNDLKFDFFIIERFLFNCFVLEKPKYEHFYEFCQFFSKEFLGSQNNSSIKEKEAPADHYPEKMQWCKKCKICWNYNKINKKTKYKCIACSEERGSDVPLCLDKCFILWHRKSENHL